MKNIVFFCIFLIFLATLPAQTFAAGHKPVYIPFTAELDAYMERYGTGVSVYFENIKTGYVYTYNADRLYPSASIIKAPYALYLYETLEELTTEHTYTENMYREGAGIIKKKQPGTVFTDAELLEYAVRISDNVAYRMLLKAYGTEGFKEWVHEKGGNTQRLRNLTGADMTSVMDAAFYVKQLCAYIESPFPDGERNAKLKNDLLEANWKYVQINAPFAHKHGLWEGAFHDMGIVYANSPYILVLMSDMGSPEYEPTKEARGLFREIANKLHETNEQLSQSAMTRNKQGLSASQ